MESTPGLGSVFNLYFHATAGATPAEALATFRDSSAAFCAVVSDLTMPRMTGLEMARRFFAVRPGIPLIIASGHLDSRTQVEARESGVQHVIHKPFDLGELATQLRAALGETAPQPAYFTLSHAQPTHPGAARHPYSWRGI